MFHPPSRFYLKEYISHKPSSTRASSQATSKGLVYSFPFSMSPKISTLIESPGFGILSKDLPFVFIQGRCSIFSASTFYGHTLCLTTAHGSLHIPVQKVLSLPTPHLTLSLYRPTCIQTKTLNVNCLSYSFISCALCHRHCNTIILLIVTALSPSM